MEHEEVMRRMMKRRNEKTLLMMNVLATSSSSSSSSRVSPSCRPARNNTICFQSEQKSETISHQNGKYQIFHLPRFIKQDLGQGGVAGLYFGIPLAGQDTISPPPHWDPHHIFQIWIGIVLLAEELEILNPYQI